MARLAAKEGGWFKMWGRKWLTDEKLKMAGETLELAYVRVLCVGNILMENGAFRGDVGENLEPDEICKKARIDRERFDLLVSHGFLAIDPVSGAYCLPNWDKHQNRGARKHVEKVEKPQEKPPKQALSSRVNNEREIVV